jgi:FkbM family methyltransferase
MAERTFIQPLLQNALLASYRHFRRSRLIRSPLGQRLFEGAYLVYKIVLEAGPIGRLRPLVTPGGWTIDVGANVGLFTLRFARWVGDGGRVIAIEPEARNFASLQRRLASSGLGNGVVAIRAVAAEAPGILHLELNPDHPGDHKLASQGEPITAVTLDQVLGEHGSPNVALIKIDVQGAEMRVLRGAAKVLDRCRPALFIEIDDAALRRQGSHADELVEFLAGLGYQAYSLRRFGAPKPVLSRKLGRNGYEDVLFLSGQGL